MTAPNSHSTAFTVTENLMQSSDDSNARPSLAAHRAKVEAEIQDAWERESLSDLCLIARRLLWGAVPELTPSATDASQARDAAHLRTTLEYIASLPDSYPASAIVARAKNALKSAATDDTTKGKA